MPKRSLAARTVPSLKPAAERVDYFDDNPPGFGLRVSPSGRKTWIYCYRIGRRSRRLTIGTYPDTKLAPARKRAHQARRDVENNIDPADVKRDIREADTFGELAADFLKSYRKKDGAVKITKDEDERIIDAELRTWKHTRAKAITRRDVKALIQTIAERPAPVMANRVLALVSKIFNWAIDQETVETNPAYRVNKPGAERTRDRVLTGDEIRTLWTALDAEPVVYRAFYRLALLTAQRMGGKREGRGEILWMKWAEVDEASHWWTIPGDRTKNGLMQRVYLTKLARAELAAVKAYQTEKKITGEYVFTTPRSKTTPITGAKHVIRRIRLRSGLDFRPHDLRRTVTTILASHGEPRTTIKKILNHTEADVTGIYDRYSYDLEVQGAFEHWERLLKGILKPKAKPAAHVLRMAARA